MSIWDSIVTPEPGQFSLRLIKTHPYGNWSWIKEPDGNVGIALELEKEYDVSSLVSTKYFSIKNRDIFGLGHILTVICEDREFHEIFEVLCADLIESSADAKSQLEAISLLKLRLNAWTQLFKSFKGINRQEIYGLAAELSFLKEWLGLNQSINNWTGPNGSSQDFINKNLNIAVEIKATSNDLATVTISSLEQLDFEGELYLCVYPVNACEGTSHGSQTLSRLVTSIRNNLNEPDSLVFERKLMATGYSDGIDLDSYTFEIGKPVYYKIASGFPRLIKANIATEISNCHYDINLRKCVNFLTTKDRLVEALR